MVSTMLNLRSLHHPVALQEQREGVEGGHDGEVDAHGSPGAGDEGFAGREVVWCGVVWCGGGWPTLNIPSMPTSLHCRVHLCQQLESAEGRLRTSHESTSSLEVLLLMLLLRLLMLLLLLRLLLLRLLMLLFLLMLLMSLLILRFLLLLLLLLLSFEDTTTRHFLQLPQPQLTSCNLCHVCLRSLQSRISMAEKEKTMLEVELKNCINQNHVEVNKKDAAINNVSVVWWGVVWCGVVWWGVVGWGVVG